MSDEGKVVRRRIREPESSGASKAEDPEVDKKESDTEDDKDTRLTLMEQVLLLGLKDKEVSQSVDANINTKYYRYGFVLTCFN